MRQTRTTSATARCLGGGSRAWIAVKHDAVKSRLARAPLVTPVRRWAYVLAAVGIAMLSTASGARGAPGDTARIDGVCPRDVAPGDEYTISRNGRFVVAECDYQVYERDRLRRRTVLVSRATGPHARRGDGGASFRPSVSDDGQIVAFASDAVNLAPGMRHGYRHVLVRDLRRNTTKLIGGARKPKGRGHADDPALSADGRFLAYDSSDFSDDYQVYVRDLRTNKTTLVSRATGKRGAEADDGFSADNLGSDDPSISADGRRVAFESDATNLAPRDRNQATDVFVRDLRAHTTTLVSRASDTGGTAGNGNSILPAISSDGRSVAFDSTAGNLDNGIPPLDRTNGDGVVYVRNLSALTTQLVSRATGPEGAAATSYTQLGSISGDGHLVAFETDVPAPSADRPDKRQSDVWVRDLTTQTTTLVSRAAGVDGPQGNDSSYEGRLTADGRLVMFRSFATNLTPDSRVGMFARELGSTP